MTETPKNRKYQKIWEIVKQKYKCTVEVHPNFCARVKKAVIKEKNQDMAFKVMNDHDYFYLRVEKKVISPDKVAMTFLLKQRYGLDGVHNDIS